MSYMFRKKTHIPLPVDFALEKVLMSRYADAIQQALFESDDTERGSVIESRRNIAADKLVFEHQGYDAFVPPVILGHALHGPTAYEIEHLRTVSFADDGSASFEALAKAMFKDVFHKKTHSVVGVVYIHICREYRLSGLVVHFRSTLSVFDDKVDH